MNGNADTSIKSDAGSVLLACAQCRQDSVTSVLGNLGTISEIRDGSIKCDRCGTEYAVVEGIPIAIPADQIQPVSIPSKMVDAEHREFGFPPTKRIAELLSRNSSGLSLDVGCGKGPYLEYFKGGLVFADVNYYFIKEALRSYNGDGRVLGVVADARNLPFLDCSFDNVFCMEMLEHIDVPEILEMVEQFKRIARVRVQVDVPNEAALLRYIRGLFHRLGVFDTTEHEDTALDYHSSFTPSLLRSRGFEVHGCIGAVSRIEIPLGFIWDIYDSIAWRLPGIAGTLIGIHEKPAISSAGSSGKASP